MTERVSKMLAFHLAREYRAQRTSADAPAIDEKETFLYQSLYLKEFCKLQTPVIYLGENDLFGFHLSCNVPLQDYVRDMGNFTPDYEWALNVGFEGFRADLCERKAKATPDRYEYFDACIGVIDTIFDYADAVRAEAQKQGATALADALTVVPRQKPQTYYQAMVLFKILIFVLRATNVSHLTLGRFDQYMYPFYCASKAAGISREELTEQTELFFIAINMDTDLYHGVQQGDNGQSLVLGGCDADGNDVYNELSDVVMDAAEALCLIDPKINLRVNKNTPLARYERATRLTAKGLGFPQYCNDDVVIPGLCKLGYELQDARNYTVAACWEFIIPGVGYEIPNIGAINFPWAVRRATLRLPECKTFEDFFRCVEEEIGEEFRPFCDKREEFAGWLRGIRNPFGSLFVQAFRENAVDMGEMTAKYSNYGLHGLGIAPAVDAIAAIRQYVFEEKSLTAQELLTAMEADFEGYEELRNRLLAAPKMGNNDPVTNEIADRVLACHAKTVNGQPNGVNGIYRAGTGAPHLYVYCSKDIGATADGRKAGMPYPSSFSPAIGTRPDGPLSVIQSFTNFDMTEVINGGPLTLEMHDNVFRNQDGIRKVAMLVKLFIERGGHQLQLNAINRERLIDAQKHPENYPNLIVRVWGWSGYFRELDPCFQNQIISRTAYTV